jgi:hypothetical protein
MLDSDGMPPARRSDFAAGNARGQEPCLASSASVGGHEPAKTVRVKVAAGVYSENVTA